MEKEWIWYSKEDPFKIFSEHREALGGLAKHLGIKHHKLLPNSLILEMPIDDAHKQPIGIVHGGTYCVLAETVASVASNLTINLASHYAVGQQINVYYFRPSTEGCILAEATPKHIGKKTQVWDITMTLKETKKVLSQANLTMAILERKQ